MHDRLKSENQPTCPECGRDRSNREPHRPGCSRGESKTTGEPVSFLGRWTPEYREAVEGKAKQFVRDCLHLFGQHEDAENDELVLDVARKVMRAIP